MYLIDMKLDYMDHILIHQSFVHTSPTIIGKSAALGSVTISFDSEGQSTNVHRFVFPKFTNRFSTGASSVEYQAGEIGTVSGIPDEHLQRRTSFICSNYPWWHGQWNSPGCSFCDCSLQGFQHSEEVQV